MHGPFLCLGVDPLSRLRRQLVPLFVAWRERELPGRTLSVAYGDSSPEGRALGKEDKSRPYRSTAKRSQLVSAKLYAPAKASPFRERWHGEAVTERVCFRGNPLSLAALDSSPEGRALGKEDKSRPHSSTAKRSQLVSTKLSASAKASPFRERWHGEAVTERVFWGEPSQSRCARQLVPLFVAWRRHLPPAGGSLSKGEPLAKRVSLVLTSQRLEEASL